MVTKIPGEELTIEVILKNEAHIGYTFGINTMLKSNTQDYYPTSSISDSGQLGTDSVDLTLTASGTIGDTKKALFQMIMPNDSTANDVYVGVIDSVSGLLVANAIKENIVQMGMITATIVSVNVY